ncbi:ECF transporter S component [Virgibacillus sp. MSJ-26]|nr:ECF transporter S component [Virgibacillus sp. MSJ-26]MBU5467092.1 ECF transporter S component [Virgibacillus sp. MSJ-26]
MIKNWKLKEIVMLSIISVVAGVLYMAFSLLGYGIRNVLTPFGLAPFGFEVIFGLWLIGSIIAAYVIRKPGAALLVGLISAAVEILSGSPGGAKIMLAGLVQGAGVELPFALTKWKNYQKRTLVLAAMSGAVFSFIWQLFAGGNLALAPWLLVSMLVVRLIASSLLGGLLGKWVSDKLAQTGVLGGYALGKEQKKKREDEAI